MENDSLNMLGLSLGALVFAMRAARRRNEKISLQSVMGPIKKAVKNESFSDEAFRRGCEWAPKPSDVIIATAPKTGTTWLQWIVCLLRSDCTPPPCEDIYQISPWIHMCYDIGIDVNIDQPHPRVFKSHQPLSCINRGGRYIVTIRAPEATAVSWYNFLKAKLAPPATEHTLSEFIRNKDFMVEDMRFGSNLWNYYHEYWRCREADNVLVLVFEDLVTDLRTNLAIIAEFIGVEADDKLLDAVCFSASKQQMLQPEVTSKLDESWTYKEAVRLGRSLAPHSWTPTSRVTKGHKDKLTEDDKAFLEEQWKKNIGDTTGVGSYEEMVADIRASLSKRFPHLHKN